VSCAGPSRTWPRSPDPAPCALTARHLIPLALAAGCVDAVSYLRLGEVFTANMTGNTVLMGIALAQGHGAAFARSATALGGFCAGVAAGRLPRRAVPGLAGEAALLLGLAALGAWVLHVHVPLIALSGAAMGLQTATARRHGELEGVKVTYITGTVTTLVLRAPRIGAPGAVWAVYACGGVAGALLQDVLHLWAFALPAGAALLSAALAWQSGD
jgi:uncharacterized membrane protein YoaK (UPF0700 family)